jgi:G3E family GTPase
VRGDLLRILCKLLARPEPPEHVVIETTGLADPAPVAQTFFVDDEVRSAYRLDAIVTVVDCLHASSALDEAKLAGVENEAVEQVAFADRILLNKTDLVPADAVDALEARLRGVNGCAQLLRTRHADAPLDFVLGVAAFDLARTLDMDPAFLDTEAEHQHDSSIASVGLRAAGPLELGRVNAWLGALLRDRGADILRSKGVLCVAGSEERFVFQGVHMQLQLGSSADGAARPWAPGEQRDNRLVFIGRNLDRAALQAGFDACRA